MSLYTVQAGLTLPQASDVNQYANIFNGTHDIGVNTLAPQLTAPSTTGFSLLAQSGGNLGVGTYQYVFTYITGQYKTDNTIQITGETVVSSALSVTTTSANKTVQVTLPVPVPVSIIGIRIYRTSVGGTDYKLVATVKAGNTSYIDSVADASRGTGTPPTANTTGTVLSMPANPAYTVAANGPSSLASNVETLISYNGNDFVNGVFTAPMAGTYVFAVSVYTNINNGSLILHPYLNGVLKGEPYKFTMTVATTWDHTMISTMVFALAKGDILKWWATSTCSAGSNVNAANSFCTVVKVA